LISIDSYGWIERFTNGLKAPEYNKSLSHAKQRRLSHRLWFLFEVYKKIKKLNGEEEALLAVAALSQTTIVFVDQTIALEAADYSLEKIFTFPTLWSTPPHVNTSQLYTSDKRLKRAKFVCLFSFFRFFPERRDGFV